MYLKHADHAIQFNWTKSVINGKRIFREKKNCSTMISSDLTRDIKISIKTIIGQLGYVLKQIDNEQQSQDILLQLKAVQSMVSKTTFQLLDEAYRKALAEKISSAYENCPGNCGNEDVIEKLRKLFPDIALEDVPEKLKEIEVIERNMQKIISEKNLDTPLPNE